MVIHVIGYIVIIVVLLACTPNKQTSKWVFTGSQNYTGWSDGMAWCIGILSSVYGFGGLETAAYFSEETRHASRTIPRASKFQPTNSPGPIGAPHVNVADARKCSTMLLQMGSLRFHSSSYSCSASVISIAFWRVRLALCLQQHRYVDSYADPT